MDVTIDLSADELKHVEREVARLQAAGEPDLTAAQYVARRLRKVLQAELEQQRVMRRELNTGTLHEVVEALGVADNQKLKGLGLQVDAEGRLTKIDGGKPS